jgi:broad specificity phosphatase PhoE
VLRKPIESLAKMGFQVTTPAEPADAAVTVWLVRHGAVASHRGDVALTERGARDAEAAGERLAAMLELGAVVEFLHAPTRRALETAEAMRRGIARAVPTDGGIRIGNPRSEQAIRNPDLYVAGTRVEMVTSVEALAAQLPPGLLTTDAVANNEFFARFWAAADPMRVWLDDDDPPGERRSDVARRFFAYARSLTDIVAEHPRHYVCVTHSGPMRAILREYVTHEDPGEPEYAEAIQLRFDSRQSPAWRFR